MRRQNADVKRRLEELLSEVGLNDARAVAVRASETDEAVSQFILELLKDPATSDNVAARALWFVPLFASPDLVAEGKRLIKDRPPIARLAASRLRGLVDMAAVPELEAVLLDDASPLESRRAALDLLRTSCEPRAIRELLRLARDRTDFPDELVTAAAAALALIQIQLRTLDVTDELCELLTSPSPDVRFVAVRSLGNIGASRAIPAIAALLSDATRTSSGEWVDAEAARVVRILRSLNRPNDSDLGRALWASQGGSAGDWRLLRDLCEKLRREGATKLVRRLESAQFMAADEMRALSFNHLGATGERR